MCAFGSDWNTADTTIDDLPLHVQVCLRAVLRLRYFVWFEAWLFLLVLVLLLYAALRAYGKAQLKARRA